MIVDVDVRSFHRICDGVTGRCAERVAGPLRSAQESHAFLVEAIALEKVDLGACGSGSKLVIEFVNVLAVRLMIAGYIEDRNGPYAKSLMAFVPDASRRRARATLRRNVA